MSILIILYTIPITGIFWKLYVKAGRPGWTAAVPGYNNIVLNEIAGKKAIFGYIAALGSILSYVNIFIKVPVLGLLSFVCGVVYLYILSNFIKQYDRGIGSWIVYIFLPIVGFFIADKANYKGTLPAVPNVASGIAPQAMNAPGTMPATPPVTNPMPPAQPQPPVQPPQAPQPPTVPPQQ